MRDFTLFPPATHGECDHEEIALQRAYLAIGTGVNLEPVTHDDRPNATSIREVAQRNYSYPDSAIVAFIEHVDSGLARRDSSATVLRDWRKLTTHRTGDAVSCLIGDRAISGTWGGIDDSGRALLQTSGGEVAVSAGDLIAT